MVDRSSRTTLVLFLSVALVASASLVGVGFGQQTDAGNETDSELTTQTTSYLRVAHAAPGAGAVDVYVDNSSVASNVPFGAVSDYLALKAGTHTVTVTVVGVPDAVVFEETVDLDARSVTTVAATLSADDGEVVPQAYADTALTPTDDESALRLVHLSPNAPAVDIVAVSSGDDATADDTEATETAAANETETEASNETEAGTETAEAETEADNETEAATETAEAETEAATETEVTETEGEDGEMTETVLAENLSYTEATDYLTVPAGDYTVEVRTADENETVVSTVDVSLDGGTTYSAWALGNVPENGTEMPPTFRVLATADASATIEFPAGTPSTPAPANETATPGENVTETPDMETETEANETAEETETAAEETETAAEETETAAEETETAAEETETAAEETETAAEETETEAAT